LGATEPAISAAATGPRLLSFDAAVDSIGVTSGAPKCTLLFLGTQWGTEDELQRLTDFPFDPATLRPICQPGSGSGTRASFCLA